VNPVNDPEVKDKKSIEEFIEFYSEKKWTHEWRRMLSENETELAHIMDSCLPKFPRTKNWEYNAVEKLNHYVMFANDEGLMNFPPARTYEGVVSGCVMISSDHPSYTDLGFINGVNCIMHKKNDINDFENKVNQYLSDIELLNKISLNGIKLMEDNYSHEKLAAKLYKDILHRWKCLQKY
jgi:spore maturation protein CgeB